MKRAPVYILIAFTLALSACAAPTPAPTPSPTLTLTPPPTATIGPAVQATLTPSTAPSVTPSATTATTTVVSASTSPASIPPPQPSKTPGNPPAPPPGVTPTGHIPAVIHLFHVWPFQALKPGDPVLIVWEFEGNNGRICAVAKDGPTDCVDVPNSGERHFTILDNGKPYWYVLYVNVTAFPNAEQIAVANVYLGCQYLWYFDQPEAAVCPQSASITGQFAAQRFEEGTMVYIPVVGRYYGLVDIQYGSGTTLRADDPLNITKDTSAEVVAPSGFYAPTSGFGYVWRGDAEVYPDWRAALGWGLEPEFNYPGLFQCDNEAPRFQFCYLKHPDIGLVILNPLGNWYYKSVSYLNN